MRYDASQALSFSLDGEDLLFNPGDTILQAAPARGVVRPLAAGGTAGPAGAPKPA